jgi:hypothetical protein
MRFLKAAGFAVLSLISAVLAVLYAGKVIYATLTYGWPDPNGSPANAQVGIPFLLMAATGTLAQWAFRRSLRALKGRAQPAPPAPPAQEPDLSSMPPLFSKEPGFTWSTSKWLRLEGPERDDKGRFTRKQP